MALGPQPQKGPTNATDCGSDPPLMAGGGQSRATGHQTLHIVHWNAERVRQKKLELQQFLKAQKLDVCCIQETHLNNTHRFSALAKSRRTLLAIWANNFLNLISPEEKSLAKIIWHNLFYYDILYLCSLTRGCDFVSFVQIHVICCLLVMYGCEHLLLNTV